MECRRRRRRRRISSTSSTSSPSGNQKKEESASSRASGSEGERGSNGGSERASEGRQSVLSRDTKPAGVAQAKGGSFEEGEMRRATRRWVWLDPTRAGHPAHDLIGYHAASGPTPAAGLVPWLRPTSLLRILPPRSSASRPITADSHGERSPWNGSIP